MSNKTPPKKPSTPGKKDRESKTEVEDKDIQESEALLELLKKIGDQVDEVAKGHASLSQSSQNEGESAQEREALGQIIEQLIRENKGLKRENAKFESQVESLRSNIEELEANKEADLKLVRDNAKVQIQHLKEDFNNQKRRIDTLENADAENRATISKLRDKVEHANYKLKEYQKDNQEYEKIFYKDKKKLDEREKDLNKRERQLQAEQEAFEKSKEKTQKPKEASNLQTVEQQLKDLDLRLKEREHQVSRGERDLDGSRKRLLGKGRELNSKSAAVEVLDREVKDAMELLEEEREKLKFEREELNKEKQRFLEERIGRGRTPSLMQDILTSELPGVAITIDTIRRHKREIDGIKTELNEKKVLLEEYNRAVNEGYESDASIVTTVRKLEEKLEREKQALENVYEELRKQNSNLIDLFPEIRARSEVSQTMGEVPRESLQTEIKQKGELGKRKQSVIFSPLTIQVDQPGAKTSRSSSPNMLPSPNIEPGSVSPKQKDKEKNKEGEPSPGNSPNNRDNRLKGK